MRSIDDEIDLSQDNVSTLDSADLDPRRRPVQTDANFLVAKLNGDGSSAEVALVPFVVYVQFSRRGSQFDPENIPADGEPANRGSKNRSGKDRVE